MELFGRALKAEDLVQYDGTAIYYGPIFNAVATARLFAGLNSDVSWQRDVVMMYGKRIETRRRTAWYGDMPYIYRYSGVARQALPWLSILLDIKKCVEDVSGETFNSCLLNLYANGEESMSWHSDNEADLLKEGAIASVSLGAERRFAFKHRRTKETVRVLLENGSLLVMKGSIQRHWVHALPPMKGISEPRINLTFRTIIG